MITIAWRNIWRNRRRTVLCIVAVAIAVFFNIFMQSMIDGMYRGIEDIVRIFDTGHVSAVSARFEADREYWPAWYPLADGAPVAELAEKARSITGVREALPRITVFATLFDSTVKHALLWGLEWERETRLNNFNLTKRSDGIIEGRAPEVGTNECMIGERLAKKAGLRVGDRIPLKVVSSQFSDKYWSPEVTGIFSFDYQLYDESVIVVPFDRLQRILGLGEGTQKMVLYADSFRDSGRIRREYEALLDDDAVVREWKENYWVAMLNSMAGLYALIFAVFQIVASFLIVNTMLMVIHERIKEIGMMGALGMNRREIVGVFFLEAVFLSLLGAAAGALVGGVSTFALSLFPIDFNAFSGGGMKELPMSGTLYLDFSWLSILSGFLFGLVVSAVCTLFPSLKSAFVEPVEALRR